MNCNFFFCARCPETIWYTCSGVKTITVCDLFNVFSKAFSPWQYDEHSLYGSLGMNKILLNMHMLNDIWNDRYNM